MSGWDESERLAEQYGGGVFVRLQEDGDSFKGMFVGEPHPHRVWFNNASGQYEDWGPEQEARKIKPTMRFGINVVVISQPNGQWVYDVKAWEMTTQSFKSLLEVKKKYGLDRFFEVTRKGKKGDTKTTYTILPEDPPSAEVVNYCKSLEMLDLSHLMGSSETTEGAGQESYTPGQPPAAPPPSSPRAGFYPAVDAPPAPAPAPAAAPVAAPAPAPAAPVEAPAPASPPAVTMVQPPITPTPAAPAVPAAVPANGASNGAANGAIDHETAHALSVVIKECPDFRAAAARFCAHFGIDKIREVPVSRKDEAIQLAQTIAAEQAAAQGPAQAETDPFS